MEESSNRFQQYNDGANELYRWIKEMEYKYDLGIKVNKRKYNKLIQLEKDYRKEAVDLLKIVNYHNKSFKTCMTPPYPQKPILEKRNCYTDIEINKMSRDGDGIPKI